MFEVGLCTWRYALKIILLTTGVFFLLSLINIGTLAGFSRFYYNTSYECIYNNITQCFNPENRLIAQWGIGLAFCIVLGLLSLFILFLVIQYIRKRRRSYEIVDTTSPIDEIEFRVDPQELDSCSSVDTDSDSDKKRKDKTD